MLKKKIFIFVIAIMACMAMCSCEQTSEISVTETEKKEQIAMDLISEFNTHYAVLEEGSSFNNTDDESRYHQIMVKDKACGLLGVYSDVLEPEMIADIQQKAEKITIGSYPAYFGYTDSGIHIIALKRAYTSAEMEMDSVAGKIRGEENEAELLRLSGSWTDIDLNLWDIYFEDLSQTRESFDVSVQFYANGDTESKIELSQITDLTDLQKEFLEKYNRTLSSNTVEGKSWNLYAVDTKSGQTNGEEVDIDTVEIAVDDEVIELK